MINAVIADDEEKICRLIQALGDWDRIGINVIATASNGLDALKIIRETKTDILITDIRMPGCDGIQLIEEIKKISPETHIIIVSGYAEFRYAQAAVRFGVTDYLLKPINKDMLNDSLSKIRDTILNERETETKLELSQKKLDTNATAIRSSFLTDCLIDPGRVFTQAELRDQYQLRISGGTYQFICAKIDGKNNKENQKFIWDKCISVFTKDLKNICKDQVYLAHNCYLYGFLDYSSKEQENVRKTLKSAMNKINSLNGLFEDDSISIAVGYSVKDISELGKAFLSAKEMVRERIVTGIGKVIEWKPEKKVLYEKRLLEKYNRAVAGALEIWSEDGLMKANQELCDDILSFKEAGGREILETVMQAGNIFIMRLNLSDQTRHVEAYYEKCNNCSTTSQLLDCLCLYTKETMHSLAEVREDEADRSIRLAKQYISNHYAEQITLEDVSSYLGLTPTYFSTFFKKKTNTGFAKYLMNVRVEAAKVLLKESNSSVSEICSMVGYNDIKHFTKVFEQVTGVKPAAYRKLYG